MTSMVELVHRFEKTEPRRFANWPDTDLSKGRPGVYGIWAGGEFLFVGLSWKDRTETDNKQAQGVWGRLQTYTIRNQKSPFITDVFDRFVRPGLTGDQRARMDESPAFASEAAHRVLRREFEYRAIVTADGAEARALANTLRSGESSFGVPTFGSGRPS